MVNPDFQTDYSKGHVDRWKVHRWLWEKRNRLGFVSLTQQELAEVVGIRRDSVAMMLRTMIQEGRIAKASYTAERSKTHLRYRVFDPVGFQVREPGDVKLRRRL